MTINADKSYLFKTLLVYVLRVKASELGKLSEGSSVTTKV